MPGSHARPNTAAEVASLQADSKKPLPGGVPVELRAGDGVAYTNTILHWGSSYGPAPIRRCIHCGYRSMLGGPTWPYVSFEAYRSKHSRHQVTAAVAPHAPAVAAARQRHEELFERECTAVLAAYNAALAGDRAGFAAQVAVLHPAPVHRLAAVALLRALAKKLVDAAEDPGGDDVGSFGDYGSVAELVAPGLSRADRVELWRRFAPFDQQLQVGGGGAGGVVGGGGGGAAGTVAGFQRTEGYHAEEVAAELTIDDVFAGWPEPAGAHPARL